MDTQLHPSITHALGREEANEILTRCVHCGFCNATCPTYQLTGDENDGPRGRIYLIKSMLESAEATEQTRYHLDRCLQCRSCESTCPSDVAYSKLYDIGQSYLSHTLTRKKVEHAKRTMLQKVIPDRVLFNTLLSVSQWVKPLLPQHLKKKIPQSTLSKPDTLVKQPRRMILFRGCVQNSVNPETDHATQRVLNVIGISASVIDETQCCGALSQHTGNEAHARTLMKANIDLLWPALVSGCEAIISNASGCGVMLKDYQYYLKNDTDYAKKAEMLSSSTFDISEIIAAEMHAIEKTKTPLSIALHIPCTLQHGQKINGVIENILRARGHTLLAVNDAHLCCGSAGAYSILQPELSEPLKQNKLDNLQQHQPDVIATANIGCQMHLQSGTKTPVVHWVTLLSS